ncbi:MAG TPA: amidohydrolase family protein [Acidimicrobiales bacterium]|jgi:N-acyl-D-aspartate/D-glutamate deacylase|nr:amidohydrolase family protein [Acidimicrobiales bacterium]
MLDLIIRGGTLIDGTGASRRSGDVGVADGRVVAVGRVDEQAERTVDADGALVTPGFVDIHTHYDGQATWDPRLQPSSGHGVTTIVMGNCGVGFAPVRPTDHAQLIELMEGVEDIPGAALHEGLPWDWGSIGEYLDALDRRPHDIDFATQVCHGPVRLFVMGQRGADREPATAEEIAEMGRIAAEGVRAGALGFTTSRTLNHRTSRGEPTPTLTAARAELVGIARALGEAGAGVLQVVSDFPDFDDEMGTLLEMMRASGRPLSVSLSQSAPGHGYRRVLDTLTAANGEGLHMRAQVAARGIGVLLGLQASINPLQGSETFRSLDAGSLPRLVARLSEPSVRAAIIDELAGGGGRMLAILDRVFELGDPPDYEPDPSSSIGARAAAAGISPAELLYDLLLRDGGETLLYWPILNYFDGNLDPAAEMLSHPHAVPGLSDGGAHVGTICDASFPTTLLAFWGRDRKQGKTFDPEWIVQRQCRATAEAVGLLDRGIVAPGYKADLNVIDFDNLGMHRPRLVFDLPAGGKRLLQPSTGYLHTFVSGVEVCTGGESTGATPGRLVRGAKADPKS